MGVSFLTPLFLAGFIGILVPIIIHLIRRYRGKVIPFPSLMFLRKLPIQAIRRRTIRDPLLLLLRIGALVLIALAFARPVLRVGGAEAGVVGTALREVVLVIDRSWSMAQGDRWEDALAEARSTLGGLVSPDRASLVVFDGMGNVLVEPTLEPSRVLAALDTLQPGWGGTQIGAGLQAASGILEASDRSRRELVLISDYQRRGWEDGPRDPLPEGTTLVTTDVGNDGIGSMIVSDVTLAYSFAEGRQRMSPVVRVVRQGESAPTEARVALQLDGQETVARDVALPSEGATALTFDPITLPDAGLQGSVLLEPEGAAAMEPFRFVVSPGEIMSVLLVQDPVPGGRGAAPYLRNALSVVGGQPIRMETTTSGGVSGPGLADVDLVVLDDVRLPAGAAGNALRAHVSAGGGLLIVAGPESDPASWDGAWDAFLPARPGEMVERDPARGATLAQVDRDHPVFIPFQGPGGSGLGTPRFYRYRELAVPEPEVTPTDASAVASAERDLLPRVLARFDDGAPALAQRRVGAGTVLVWTSTLNTAWNDFPLHPVFLPLVREMVRFAGGTQERVPYFIVGQPLDARFVLVEAGILSQEDLVDLPAAGDPAAAPVGPTGPPIAILVGPGGSTAELFGTTGELVHLSQPGFYQVREPPEGSPVRLVLAVNPDVREADPARIEPEDLTLAVAPASATTQTAAAGGDLTQGENEARTALEDGERRQSVWRFLLLGAAALLLLETILAATRKPLAKRA